MSVVDISHNKKILILGTALWGFGIDRTTAYDILDRFLEFGGNIIDTASNYPINSQVKDFGLAASWIADWIAISNIKNISVNIKIGAIDNIGSPNTDLSALKILDSASFFRDSLESALLGISVHWDNRKNNNDYESILETVEAMSKIKHSGIQIGFSGIKRPDFYLKAAPELSGEWWIQIKENASTCAARLEYEKFFPNAHYIAYGINMGGLKNTPPTKSSSLTLRNIKYPHALVHHLSAFLTSNHNLNPAPQDFNELALLLNYINPALSGMIIGPRNIIQLENTMCYWEKLNNQLIQGDYINLTKLITLDSIR